MTFRAAQPIALLALFLALALPAAAQACSNDDTAYFDGFLDTSCLQALNGTTLDTFGGLRLTTNGASAVTSWDSEAHFEEGITWQATEFEPIGTRTLATDASGGSGTPAKLVLPATLLPLMPDAIGPVLSATPAVALDNDNVYDPSVAKIGATYMMWYAGSAEDGRPAAIFAAGSADGKSWTRLNEGEPVLVGSAASFDQHGVSGPEVIYDPTDEAAPYKMWYSGDGEVFGAIGYATSSDGIAWTKHDDPETAPVADPVLDYGRPGAPDSFAAADPSILRDGTTWKMWYTGDDSNKKRIAYATSSDGIAWTKGGKVIAPEDPGTSANIEFGAYSPTVWKVGDSYEMLFTGRKIVSGTTFQTKIISGGSDDGINWSSFSIGLNSSGSESNFDYSNLDSPFVLHDPGTANAYKAYYAGNTLDDGHGHDRIGLAVSKNGSSFSKSYSASPSSAKGAVLDIGTLGTEFDARQASGPTVAAPAGATPKLVGFYWGTRGNDFKPRLGEATSEDGGEWAKVPVSEVEADGGALFSLGGEGAFDRDGQRDPGVFYEQDAGGGSDDYFLYFTGLAGGGSSIGFSAAEAGESELPDNASWSLPSEVFEADGSGFDSSAVSHPSLIADGDYVLYYTGTDGGGNTAIGRAVSPLANGPDGPFGEGVALSLSGEQTCDPDGFRDPVVSFVGAGDYRMLYTGLENLEGSTIERGCYATSADGITWTRQGVALNPSQRPRSSDEIGVEPSAMLVDEDVLHVFSSGVDHSGRTHGHHSTATYPTPEAAQAGIPNGWATYQLGDENTSPRDFRKVTRSSQGDAVSLWMSYEQPYSSGGSEDQYWSDYFPVAVEDPSEALSILLTVRGVRWQARLSEPAGSPALDKVEIEHAPVQFSASGDATTEEIVPPVGVAVDRWTSLTVNGSLISPAGSGSGNGTIKVLSADGTRELASDALSTNGDTTVDLTGISPQTDPSLRVRFDLASESPFSATPLVSSLKVLYNTAPPPPPPPPPPPVLCQGKVATVIGTPGPDLLKGTAKADVIAALGGNDRVRGLRGNDRVCGGGGRDRIFGDGGRDRLVGQGGNDIVFGGNGPDRLVGQAGKDKLVGGRGRDRAFGGAKSDSIFGGGGNDILFGQAGADRLAGGAGRKDLCNGGPGRDTGARSCERRRRIP